MAEKTRDHSCSEPSNYLQCLQGYCHLNIYTSNSTCSTFHRTSSIFHKTGQHVTSLTEPASHLATKPAVPSLTEPPSVHSVHALSPSSVLLCLSPQSIIATCPLSSNQPSEYMPSLQSTGNSTRACQLSHTPESCFP